VSLEGGETIKEDDEQAQRDYIQSLIKKSDAPTRPYFNEAALPIIEQAENKARNKHVSSRDIEKFLGQSILARLLNPIQGRKTTIETSRNEHSCPPLPNELLFSPELTRGVLPSREEYIRYSKEVSPEGYKDFHEATFWSMLSTVAARRIAIPLSTKQYTPLYIILTARSTLYAKTATANVMRKILKAADFDWLLGSARITPQKLLSEMAGAIPANYGEMHPEEQSHFKRRLAMSGQRGWYYNEFGKFVKSILKPNSIMADFNELLLVMDDCDDQFEYATQIRGTEVIDRPYLSLLGSMTPSSIRDHVQAGAESWTDGFNARFVFVAPPREEAALNAPFGLHEVPLPYGLIRQLKAWNDRLGIPTIELEPVCNKQGKETGKYKKIYSRELQETPIRLSYETYEAWKSYRSALKDIHMKFNHDDLDASYGRLPIKALRVAGLVASFENSPQIEIQHWAIAQEVAERWRGSLHQMYLQINMPNDAPTIEDKILDTIAELKEKDIKEGKSLPMALPTTRDIGRKLHASTRDLEPYLLSLVRNGAIKKIKAGERSKETFRYDIEVESVSEDE